MRGKLKRDNEERYSFLKSMIQITQVRNQETKLQRGIEMVVGERRPSNNSGEKRKYRREQRKRRTPLPRMKYELRRAQGRRRQWQTPPYLKEKGGHVECGRPRRERTITTGSNSKEQTIPGIIVRTKGALNGHNKRILFRGKYRSDSIFKKECLIRPSGTSGYGNTPGDIIECLPCLSMEE